MSKKEKHIDDIIKNSFDEQADDFDFGSWDDIEDRLDRENDVDKVVVSAFDLPEEEVPSSVWSNVNDELDVSTVWNRINLSLDKRKRRALWWWNAASVAMGSIFLILLTQNLINPGKIEQRYAYESTDLNVDSIVQPRNTHSYTVSNVIREKNSTTLNAPTSSEKMDPSHSTALSSNIEQLTPSIENDVQKKLNKEIDQKAIPPILDQYIAQAKTDSVSELKEVSRLSPKVTNQLLTHDQRIPDSLVFSSDDPILNNGSIKHWTAGITSGFLSTNLMDALFRQSIAENSLVTPEFSLAINPGVFAQYRTQNNWIIQADLYLNYKISRRVSLYEELSYVTRKTELNYQRLHLYGGKRFLISSSTRCSTFFETSVGGFVSYLSDQKEFRGRTLISNEKTLSDWNIGLDSDIGIVHNFDRISLAYGAQINKGLLNVMKDVSTKSWNRASTLSTGIYIRLGYQF